MECPYNKQEIGNNSWHLLHTIAAFFPDTPSEKEKKHYSEFFTSFPYVYPCRPCAKDFTEIVKENPPDLNSRAELSVWLCRMHNIVNAKINKPEFNCSIKNLDQRWKKGPPECYEQNTPQEDIVY